MMRDLKAGKVVTSDGILPVIPLYSSNENIMTKIETHMSTSCNLTHTNYTKNKMLRTEIETCKIAHLSNLRR